MLEEIFGTSKPVLGVIHLLPLPGSPRWDGRIEPIILRAEQEASALATGGVHGIIIENFFDAPFAKSKVDTATACAMTLVTQHVMSICDLPIGVNVLRNDAMTALAIASTTGARFIRVNVYTGASVTDQGLIEGQAHDLLMYRRALGASKNIKILADVMVKHASPLAADSEIGQIAKDTVNRGLADAVIVSGLATGQATDIDDIKVVRQAVPNTPIFIGSGITKDNIANYLDNADGIIVASCLKRQGVLENPIDTERVRALMNSIKSPSKIG